MAFKTIQEDFGVTVDLGNYMFTFSDKSHTLVDLTDGKVRITRNIDGLSEIFSTPISNFVNLAGDAVATTFAELDTYLKTNVGGATAGTGLTKDGTAINLKTASISELGGIKIGTGLSIDGDGKVSATATSEETVTVSSEAAMLLLPQQQGGYRVNRTDLERLYYLNSGQDPSVIGNWTAGPSTALAVLTFNGRNGAVEPQKGDYKSSMIKMTHDNTGVNGFLGIDDTGIYWDSSYDSLNNDGDSV